MQAPSLTVAPSPLGHLRRSTAVSLKYPERLSLYLQPPELEITVEQFEIFALDRLQVLKDIESALLRNAAKSDLEMQKLVEDSLRKHSLLLRAAGHTVSTSEIDEERRKDCISHFILRLAYCRSLGSEELRQWLIRYETLLLKYRWEMAYKDEKQRFVEQFQFKPIPNPEKEAMSQLLRASCPSVAIERESFFKVPFEWVPDLVGRRDVYLSNGFAYVPQSSLISVILIQFKQRLLASLDITAKALPRMDDDDRLKPLLSNMSKHYLSAEYEAGKNMSAAGTVTHNDVDKLVAHFPPCMRHLHTQLRREQHLKHFGRMQYSLFLKGLGMSMEEALIFWRKAFGKLSDDQFQKGGYVYNIRHNYGQEGKRANYTPYSCVKIITTNPPSHGDSHGCPFKHFGKENLQSMLQSHGLNDQGTREVMELVKGGHYQVACTKYYEITRGKFNPHTAMEEGSTIGGGGGGLPESTTRHNMMDTISHPNQFTELSLKQASEEQKPTPVKMEAS